VRPRRHPHPDRGTAAGAPADGKRRADRVARRGRGGDAPVCADDWALVSDLAIEMDTHPLSRCNAAHVSLDLREDHEALLSATKAETDQTELESRLVAEAETTLDAVDDDLHRGARRGRSDRGARAGGTRRAGLAGRSGRAVAPSRAAGVYKLQPTTALRTRPVPPAPRTSRQRRRHRPPNSPSRTTRPSRGPRPPVPRRRPRRARRRGCGPSRRCPLPGGVAGRRAIVDALHASRDVHVCSRSVGHRWWLRPPPS